MQFEQLLLVFAHYIIQCKTSAFFFIATDRYKNGEFKRERFCERTFCGLQPHPGNGSPSSPMGHGASSPGTPWSPLSPLSPLRPFLPTGPWNTINGYWSVTTVAYALFVLFGGFTPCVRRSQELSTGERGGF